MTLYEKLRKGRVYATDETPGGDPAEDDVIIGGDDDKLIVFERDDEPDEFEPPDEAPPEDAPEPAKGPTAEEIAAATLKLQEEQREAQRKAAQEAEEEQRRQANAGQDPDADLKQAYAQAVANFDAAKQADIMSAMQDRKIARAQQQTSVADSIRGQLASELSGGDPDAEAFLKKHLSTAPIQQLQVIQKDPMSRELLQTAAQGVISKKPPTQRGRAPGNEQKGSGRALSTGDADLETEAKEVYREWRGKIPMAECREMARKHLATQRRRN
jgi:hypothetical protein